MSFDAKLILAALDKHFDAVEARWDRFFAAQDQRWAKQVAPGDVPGEHNFQAPIVTDEIRTRSCPTPTDPDAPSCIAAAAPVSPVDAGQKLVQGGPIDAMHLLHGYDSTCFPTATSTAPTMPPTPPTWLTVQPGASAWSSVARGADEATSTDTTTMSLSTTARDADETDTTNITDTKCLTDCLSHDITLPKPISVASTFFSAPATSPTSVDSSLGTDKQSSKAPDDPPASYDPAMQVHRYDLVFC